MRTTEYEALAADLHCIDPDCNEHPLTFEGTFGPRDRKFGRFLCPLCATSFPEGAPSIDRQIYALTPKVGA